MVWNLPARKWQGSPGNPCTADTCKGGECLATQIVARFN